MGPGGRHGDRFAWPSAVYDVIGCSGLDTAVRITAAHLFAGTSDAGARALVGTLVGV
jgi:hypothetical protein